MYQDTYQKIIEYFSYNDFRPEYDQARVVFEKKIGTIFDDHPFFESWIEAFIEYFTFDARLPTYGIPPVVLYHRMFKDSMSETELQDIKTLMGNRLTMVSFQSRSKNGTFRCIDVFDQTPKDYMGVDINHDLMLKKDDWMILRSIEENNQTFVFGSTWHFPREINHVLKQNLRRLKHRIDFIHDCMAKKVFSESYRHVDLEKIFETNFERKDMKGNHAQA